MTQKPAKRQLTTDDLVNGIRILLHQDDDDMVRDEKYNRNADQKITVGVAEGICGKEWTLVKQVMEEIADHQPQDEFVIVKDEKD